MTRRAWALAVLLLPGIMLAACAGGGNPAQMVETYLRAKAAGDGETVRNLLCARMEAQYEAEALSFSGFTTRVERLACVWRPETNTVTCAGAILVDYGGENQAFPFGTYAVVQESGAWKWCGETAP